MTRLLVRKVFIGRALLLGALAAVPSCGDRTATGPAPSTVQASVGNVAPKGQKPTGRAQSLLRCEPVPPNAVVQRVGPEGGTIEIGPYSLVIPQGALDGVVTIVAKIPHQQAVVEFKADGLILKQPAALTMSYANCDRPDSTQSLQIVVVGDSLNVLYDIPSTVDTVALKITGKVPFFTNYAVAW